MTRSDLYMVEGSVYLCMDNETLLIYEPSLLIPDNHQRDGILAIFLTMAHYYNLLVYSFIVET